MRLEKIVLDGFKSFADKIELSFDSPITAIVGPNGCGKSNIVDAVKWVLGEQSVKSLRSDHMADVIFSGSSSKKALGTAEASLLISNTTGQLPIEASEVQISRRIYKSGESEYRINNKICRLKDIRELFMDTGIGVKAYSIIEQGQVEQLVTASKTDRRNIFEEAAGISKYKAHKKEALRKLERCEQNLLRLADILNEVGKQLRSIKHQAGKARSYLKYTERLKELQLNYSLVEYHRIHTESIEKRKQEAAIEEQFASVSAQTSKKDAELSELGHKIIETENEVNRADNTLVTAESKIEQHLQRIEFLRTRLTELQERERSLQEKTKKLQEQKKALESDLSLHREEQTECEEKLQQKSEETEKLQKTIEKLNTECAELEAELDDEKSGIIDIVRMTAQLHNELQSISIYRDNLTHQKSRLADRAESSEAELERLLTEKAQHKSRLVDIEKVLSELEKKLEAKRKEAEKNETQKATGQKCLANNKESRSALSSELAVLKDMEQRLDGLKAGVKNILEKSKEPGGDRYNYVEGILADIISANIEYAGAVEAALEGKTDTVVVKNINSLFSDAETIKKLTSRANFVSAGSAEPFVDKTDFSKYDCVKGRLIEFVNYDSKYASLVWKLLGKTIVVDTIESAVELSAKTDDSYSYVTLAGEFLGSDGTLKLGPLGKSSGLISRKSRLRQLQDAIGNIDDEIGSLEKQLATYNQTSEHLAKLRKELRTAIYEANTEKMHFTSKLSVIEQNIDRLGKEQPLITSEIDQLEEQISRTVQKEYDSKQKLEELEAVNNERSAHIKQLEAAYTGQKSQLKVVTEELTNLRIELGQTVEQNKALKQSISNIQNQLEQNITAAGIAQQEKQSCAKDSKKTTAEILNYESKLTELYVDKETSQQNSRELHEQVQKLLDEQKQTEQLIRQLRAEQNQIEQKIRELKIELGQLEVKEQNLIERVQDELQIDLADSYENYEDNEIDWEAVREEITDLRAKIERLGNVNLDAIEQQEALEKRYDFLSTQVEDLNKSKAHLQQLINKLNKQSREKFQDTFGRIRENFQQIFRKLFGGGKADVILEDLEDILEAGIEIIAQPPGKEAMSISLLSGGEKSLAAIALLFAVFKTKPSPFCFLDEVDAALDEANNERFNLMIKEFQRNSQFIIITHAKRTMSIADMLYGITMQRRGVSEKISVRFDEYEPEEQPAAVA